VTGQVTVTNADAQVSNALTFTVLMTAEVARGFDSGQTQLGAEPLALAVTPDGGYAYVATREGVEAIVVSPSLPNYLISTPILYPGGVDAVAATPNGRRVYGVSANTHELIEINSDPTTGLLFNTVLSSLDLGASPRCRRRTVWVSRSPPTRRNQVWDIKLGSATYQQQVNALPTWASQPARCDGRDPVGRPVAGRHRRGQPSLL
jgi:DNA-binding beta-propeller fold protein YncE